MYLWKQPKITIVAKTHYYGAPHINWKSDSDNSADQLSEFSGRLCYLSYGSKAGLEGGHKLIDGRSTNKAYLKHLIESGHGSVLEHTSWSLLLEGVSRALTHELIRHRHFSYSQLSQRYVDESEVGFVVPPELKEDGLPWFEKQCAAALESYKIALNYFMERIPDVLPRTIRLKRARQAARALLPNATETKLVVTGNARAWRHFLSLRGNHHADLEIRKLAVEIAKLLKNDAPNIFQDLHIYTDEEDGIESVTFTFEKNDQGSI